VRILIVEDDDGTRELLAHVLTLAGWACEPVSSAEEGEQRLEAGVFDVILLDVGLPGMTGVEACRKWKADPRLNKIPVVMVTAEGRFKSKVEGLDAGADDYVVKPVRPKELLARLDALLRRYKKELN
jgi:two-component system, OmpR family, phosphate regulon response regulator PhoB